MSFFWNQRTGPPCINLSTEPPPFPSKSNVKEWPTQQPPTPKATQQEMNIIIWGELKADQFILKGLNLPPEWEKWRKEKQPAMIPLSPTVKICPITQWPIKEAKYENGVAFEREALERWYKVSSMNPITGSESKHQHEPIERVGSFYSLYKKHNPLDAVRDVGFAARGAFGS